jgi:hypothetical protein
LDRRGFPLEAVVSLVISFNEGMMLERLSGISEGHRELLGAIDQWLETLEAQKGASR